jgi:hypothetical protein
MRRLAVFAPVAAGVLALSACGSVESTRTVTVTTVARTLPAPTSHGSEPDARTEKPVMTACDANVRAMARTTSCAFAENVFYAFWKAWRSGHDSVAAFSPATQRSYAIRCTAGGTVICRGGDGAEVRFPMSAVRVYTATAARRYARTHDTGVQAAEPQPADPQPSDDGGIATSKRDGCDPSYEGACLIPTRPTTTARAAAAMAPSTPAR